MKLRTLTRRFGAPLAEILADLEFYLIYCVLSDLALPSLLDLLRPAQPPVHLSLVVLNQAHLLLKLIAEGLLVR